MTAADTQSALPDLISAFKADNKPLATAIEALLKDLESGNQDGWQPATAPVASERLSQFLSDLPSLLPNDPEMAAILAEEMAKQFSDTSMKARAKIDANGMEHSEENGQFVGNGEGGLPSEKKDPLTTINEWDDPKTKKMKERYIKMLQKNQQLKDELSRRHASIEQKKNEIRKGNVDLWKLNH